MDLKKSYHHSGPSQTNLCGRTNLGPTQSTEPPEHKPLVVSVVVVGPCEEEEEGIGIASDVDKVEGEDPDTRARLSKGDRVRRDVGDLGSWVCPPHETPGP